MKKLVNELECCKNCEYNGSNGYFIIGVCVYCIYKNHFNLTKNSLNTRKLYHKLYSKYIKGNFFENNFLYPNPFNNLLIVEKHHIDNKNIVILPKELHRLYMGKHHRSMLLPIVKQIYPDLLTKIRTEKGKQPI